MQALAVDKNGILYAATNPDGKVYRIERTSGARNEGQNERAPSRPANSPLPYISIRGRNTYGTWSSTMPATCTWPPAITAKFIASLPRGEHSVFFKSDEAHIRVLSVDAQGNLIAGSDGSGLVYRIKPSGEGFVLYSAPKKEITALAIDKAGNIYAAGVGEKRARPHSVDLPFARHRTDPRAHGRGGRNPAWWC